MNTTPDPQVDLVSAALVQAQGAIKAAEFDSVNPFFKAKYATLGSVIEASRAALLESGLAILQRPTIVDGLVSVQTTIIHKSGQTLDGGVMSLRMEQNDRNSDAQIAGSILTYLKRYAWASVLGIYADEDKDGNDAPKGTRNAPGRSEPSQHAAPITKTPPSATKVREVATEKHKLRALNNLHAAPGQDQIALVDGYLRSKGWIKGEQGVMDFPLEFVPTTKEEMTALTEDVTRFETTMRSETT